MRHMPIFKSDHAPILLSTESRCPNDPHERLFRFESFWLSKEGCNDIVSTTWKDGINFSIQARLESCATSLKEWAEGSFGETRRQIKNTEKKLAKAQKLPPDSHMLATCSKLASELDRLHQMEEAY